MPRRCWNATTPPSTCGKRHSSCSGWSGPERVYLDSRQPTPEGEDTARLVSLHPLLWHDLEGNETFFLNARRGKARIELLSYSTGKTLDRSDLGPAQQQLLGRVLNLPVGAADLAAWAARSVAGEE